MLMEDKVTRLNEVSALLPALFRYGVFTKESKNLHREAMDLIRKSKDIFLAWNR